MDESIHSFILFRILTVHKRNCEWNSCIWPIIEDNTKKLPNHPIFPVKIGLWEGHGSNFRGQNYFFFMPIQDFHCVVYKRFKLLLGMHERIAYNFFCMFLNPNIFFFNLNLNCSNLLDMKNLQEQVWKTFYYQELFWPGLYCCSDRENFLKFEAEGREFAKFLSTIGQNNFDNKIPFKHSFYATAKKIWM